jgi:hypothetical protein
MNPGDDHDAPQGTELYTNQTQTSELEQTLDSI